MELAVVVLPFSRGWDAPGSALLEREDSDDEVSHLSER